MTQHDVKKTTSVNINANFRHACLPTPGMRLHPSETNAENAFDIHIYQILACDCIRQRPVSNSLPNGSRGSAKIDHNVNVVQNSLNYAFQTTLQKLEHVEDLGQGD